MVLFESSMFLFESSIVFSKVFSNYSIFSFYFYKTIPIADGLGYAATLDMLTGACLGPPLADFFIERARLINQ